MLVMALLLIPLCIVAAALIVVGIYAVVESWRWKRALNDLFEYGGLD